MFIPRAIDPRAIAPWAAKIVDGPFEGRYSAFLSYSHATDSEFGPQLKDAIEKFGKSWNRARARRVFLDNANLAVAPDLWREIETALASSDCFLLLASRKAAASPWVEKEVRWWLDRHQSAPDLKLYVLLTEGTFVWDGPQNRVDASTTALPRALREAMCTEPRWIDLRDLRGITPAQDPLVWQDRVADVVAAVDGVPKDSIAGEPARQARRTRRMAASVITALSLLLVAVSIAAVVVAVQRNTAQEQALQATARQLVADAENLRDSQPNLARQLLVQAHRLATNDPTTADLVTGALIRSSAIPRVIAARSLAWDLAFTPDGRQMAVASNSGVQLHDTATDAVVSTLDTETGPTRSLSISPDGQLLATGALDGMVRVFDLTAATGPTVISRFQPNTVSVDSLRFVGSSDWMAVSLGDGTVGLWDISIRQAPRSAAIVPGSPELFAADLAVSPDGTLLATAAAGDRIALYDTTDPANPRQRALLSGHTGQVTALAFTAGGSILASGARDDTVRLWSLADPGAPAALGILSGQSFGISSVAFSADSATLAAGSGDHTIHLWDVTDPSRPRQGAVLAGHSDNVRALAFSLDSQMLASASADGVRPAGADYANSTIRLWPVSAGARREFAARLVPGGRVAPAFTPDGRVVAVGHPTTLWDVADLLRPRLIGRVPTSSQGGQATAFGPGGRILVSGEPLVVWDSTDPAHLTEIIPGLRRDTATVAAAVSPNGHVAVTGTPLGPYRLWSLDGTDAVPGATLGGSAAAAQGAAFAPTGDLLAAIDEGGGVRIWNIADPNYPRVLTTLAGAESAASLSFGRQGTLLAVGSATGTITLWDVAEVARPAVMGTLTVQAGAVEGIALHPAGTLLASASDGSGIRLTSVADGARPVELATLDDGNQPSAAQVSFSPDGAVLAVAGSAFVGMWDVDPRRLAGRLCGESAPIAAADWARYMPNLTYDPPCQ